MLRALWSAWKVFAHRLALLQARVLFTVLYALLIVPFGLVARVASDPLQRKPPPPPSYWRRRNDPPDSLGAARRQS